MKKITVILFLSVFVFIQTADAKIWRINNNIGITADFTSLGAALSSAAVLAGDTIHLESSPVDYGGGLSVTKRLVIIGTGYYLSETAPMVANPFTQANTTPASIYGIYFNPGSKGSVISGVTIKEYCIIHDSLITVERCNINNAIYFGDNGTGFNCWADTIRHNAINSFTAGGGSYGTYKNILVYNNIIYGNINFSNNINNINGFFINNDFVYAYSAGQGNPVGITSTNFVYQNNIFGYVNFGAYQSFNVYFNNICNGTGVPAGNNNIQNVDVTNIVYNDWASNGAGFSSDGRFQLKTGGSNPAIGAGTINNTTIDCGAFGGPAPYILSGMPNVPSIYALTVPTQINTGTNTMNISLSSQSH